MLKISSEQFRAAFLGILLEVADDFPGQWKSSAEDYSSFMRNNVFRKIANTFGIANFYTDYYTLDAVFYGVKKTENSSLQSIYAKPIVVAIEHVNSAAGSCEEMNKLQHFNSPLKVLITYAKEGSETDILLTMYEQIIREADCFEDIATLRRQLVVFGEPITGNNWRFYVYESAGFKLLNS